MTMTKYKEIKRALEKALEGKAQSCKSENPKIEAITTVCGLNVSIVLVKTKSSDVYYYSTSTVTGEPISWHNHVAYPETWIGENYKIKKYKGGRSDLHIILDGVSHLGHFPRECLGEKLRSL